MLISQAVIRKSVSLSRRVHVVARSWRSSSVNVNFKVNVNKTNHAISHRRWMTAAGVSVASQQDTQEKLKYATAAGLAALGLVFVGSTNDVASAQCGCAEKEKTKNKTKKKSKKQKQDDHHWTPAEVAAENFDDVIHSHDMNKFPEYTSDQVAEKDGEDGKPVWMSYGGVVYDVTDFIRNHPGGSEKIMMAAGSSIEPYWHIYRQHFASDLPTRLMEHMAIGRLAEKDQEYIDEQMDILYESDDDPFALEPMRHKALKIHSDTPMNAETPENLLTGNYLTPNSLFYIRHHHPVPFLTEEQIKTYKLEVDLSAWGKGKMIISLEDLKKMPKTEIASTLQCSGNRRSGFNQYHRTSGTPWGQGALSTAKWGGVRLSDLMKYAGLDDAIEAEEKGGMEHVRFHGLDGMSASIGIEKAMNPYGDVIVCYEMNGEPLPRDHGFPLRLIVPGYAAVRNVKWVKTIELAKEEAEGPWQRGLNYKTLPPNVTDANDINLDEMPSMTEASLFSGITSMEPHEYIKHPKPGDTIMMKARGWAWAGGGRNIVRVDVTGDGSKTWATAKLNEGNGQRFGRAWAWTFWEAEVPAIVQENGSVQLKCKAIDLAFNVQPESCEHIWNVRGLGNNSWYEKSVRVM